MASIQCKSQERSDIDFFFLKRTYLVLNYSIRVLCIGGGHPSGALVCYNHSEEEVENNIKALVTHLMVR